MTKIEYRCTVCRAEGVKLWRVYQSPGDGALYCVTCAEGSRHAVGEKCKLRCVPPSDQIGWLVPAVPTVEGDTFWGYTSVPPDRVTWWHNLPLDKADEYGPLGIDDVN